ncbi:hypothetical protein [Nocardia sp. NPDC057668]|uniref:hypothetical protein n=1 Tax=Nocardia sp. NPDC057668 TaxID=3346202 RepID=UPI00366C18FC
MHVRRPKLAVSGHARDHLPAETPAVALTRYQFTVSGEVDRGALDRLPGEWTANYSAGTTVLCGPVSGAVEMHGVLARFDEFGLDLLNLHRLETAH